MERNLSLKEKLTPIYNEVNSKNNIKPKFKKPIDDFMKNFYEDNSGKKVNLTVIGNDSVGKTTLINLMIRHLITLSNNRSHYFQTAQNQSKLSSNSNNPLNEEDEEEEEEEYDGFVKIPTKETENSYFVCFIENSDTKDYKIIIEVNSKEDREALIKLEAFKYQHFDRNHQIIFDFLNNEEGIKKMNKFLKDIDSQCFNVIRKRKKDDMDYKQQNQEEFILSKMIVKVPNFPIEFRLIDPPGFSTKSFRKAFIKMIYELNFINFFLKVNDIYSRESYSIADEVLKEISSDYGSPIVYFFFTKGDKFLKDFPKINKDYNAHVRINNSIIKNFEEIKSKINFRKIIPINDKEYNEDVKKCLTVYFDDLTKTTTENGLANYEASVMLRLRRLILDTIDCMLKESDLSQKQKESLEKREDEALSHFKDEITEYFNDLSDFDTFKNKYPDIVEELHEAYESHERENEYYWNRSNYIKKHIELSFEDFQKIVLKKPHALLRAAVNQIINGFEENYENFILERIPPEVLPNPNSNMATRIKASLKLIGAGAISMVTFNNLEKNKIIDEGFLSTIGAIIIPCITATIGGLILISPYSVLWSKKDTREDIMKVQIRWLADKKYTFIENSMKDLEDNKEKLIYELKNNIVPEEVIKNLSSHVEKIKPNSLTFSNFNYREEFLACLLEKPRLKNFFTKSFDYKEEEQSD